MKINEYAPYITGEIFSREACKPYRADKQLFTDISQLVQDNTVLSNILKTLDNYSQFYEIAEDVAHFVPKQAREEIFYGLKNGFISEDVPAKVIYFVKKAYKLYELPNLICKLIPEKDMTTFTQQNYTENGISFRDVVCNFGKTEYVPLAEGRNKVKYSDGFSEIYIRENDMVAAVPNRIADMLSYDDIEKIKVSEEGLHINGSYLRTLGDYYGVSNSIYDLRRLY